MANPKRAYSENVSGTFFVDDTCIDCDLCRQIAPAVFTEDDDHSIVYRQPETPIEAHRAAMALVACPTGSIGTRSKIDIKTAAAAYPELIDGQDLLALDKDLLVVPVPGHTRGHIVLLYRDKYLFTGDHLAWSDSRRGLIAFRDVAWYSWPEQTKSMKRLLDLRFRWVLPGHGRRGHQSEELMHQKLKECIECMKNGT